MFSLKLFTLRFVPQPVLVLVDSIECILCTKNILENIHSLLPFGVKFQREPSKQKTAKPCTLRLTHMPLYQLSPRRKNKYYMINK